MTDERETTIASMCELKELVDEMENTVADLRETATEDRKEMAEHLTGVANSLRCELRERILQLVRQNLGPEQQANIMLVLRTAGELVDVERAELQRAPEQFGGLRIAPNDEAARKLRDVEFFDRHLRNLARDILRMMADHNFQNRAR